MKDIEFKKSKKTIGGGTDICFDLLKNNIIDKMINEIDKSKKINKEIGFNINKNYDIIDYCEGHKCSLKLKKPKEPIGNYHTHPLSDAPIFSNTDLNDAFIKNYNFTCLGIEDEKNKYISCIEIDKNEEYEKLSNKYKEFKTLEKEYKKADAKTKLKMLQENIFKDYTNNNIINFMKKQKTCLVKI